MSLTPVDRPYESFSRGGVWSVKWGGGYITTDPGAEIGAREGSQHRDLTTDTGIQNKIYVFSLPQSEYT